jgi:hypothetical protein
LHALKQQSIEPLTAHRSSLVQQWSPRVRGRCVAILFGVLFGVFFSQVGINGTVTYAGRGVLVAGIFEVVINCPRFTCEIMNAVDEFVAVVAMVVAGHRHHVGEERTSGSGMALGNGVGGDAVWAFDGGVIFLLIEFIVTTECMHWAVKILTTMHNKHHNTWTGSQDVPDDG